MKRREVLELFGLCLINPIVSAIYREDIRAKYTLLKFDNCHTEYQINNKVFKIFPRAKAVGVYANNKIIMLIPLVKNKLSKEQFYNQVYQSARHTKSI